MVAAYCCIFGLVYSESVLFCAKNKHYRHINRTGTKEEARDLKMIKFLGLLCLVSLASACCMVSKWEAFEGFTVGASKEGQGSYTEVRTRLAFLLFTLSTHRVYVQTILFFRSIVSGVYMGKQYRLITVLLIKCYNKI